MVSGAIIFAVAAALLSVIAEHIHARRVMKVARLAFGPSGKPAWLFGMLPKLRPIAIALGVFGAIVLMKYDPVQVERLPTKAASRHLLICMDVSPSMQISDAGPDPTKISRALWSGKLMQGVLDRIDMQTTRISLVAYYTDALVILEDTFDKEVIRNALDGLPLYAGFKPGATDMRKGVQASLDLARKWPENSATLVIVGDGDNQNQIESSRIPNSIADTIVVGVGDPDRATIINGHSSRQDTLSLRQLAARLGGYYHQGNSRHLPSEVIDKLSMLSPTVTEKWTLREIALVCLISSCICLGMMNPILLAFGTPRQYRNRIGGNPPASRSESVT